MNVVIHDRYSPKKYSNVDRSHSRVRAPVLPSACARYTTTMDSAVAIGTNHIQKTPVTSRKVARRRAAPIHSSRYVTMTIATMMMNARPMGLRGCGSNTLCCDEKKK